MNTIDIEMSLMVNLKDFLAEHGFISIIVAYALGGRISILSESFFNDLIIPILDVDWNGDGKSDKLQLSRLTYDIGPIKLKYGRFLLSLLNIIISIYVIFSIANIMQQYIKK